ncbi:MAG TPA: M1 family metallopeptidase, partial [Flavobacterium sp.]
MKELVIFLLVSTSIFGQKTFTRKDSLQGGLRPERTSYDVLHYGLDIKINPDEKTISGFNEIQFRVNENTTRIQVDLFANMQVDSILLDGKNVTYLREFNAVFINTGQLTANTEHKINFYYSGKPQAAKAAPWDGGFDWKKDQFGKPFAAVAVQGTGASLWYPCKDSQTDEPENGATVKVAVPNGLTAVSNGRLIKTEDLKNGYTRWDWQVKNPINNYNITVNIADYVHIHDNYNDLDIDYYVLRENEEKARIHFGDVKPMLACFESKFGKYPFASDSFKLVETPYLGMEHQSAVAYGNKYLKGYLGNDLSHTGIGLLFDYIIIHESGHEWFGNSITSKDIADMWIHEGFTMYTEAVFVECQMGYEKSLQYINGMKQNISNDRPIIGSYGVNNEGSGDMYNKGALMLNTIRHIINDDVKWWAILMKFSQTYRHAIIDTETTIKFFNDESGMDLTAVFSQYLRTINIPELNLRINKGNLEYKWQNVNADFNMPVDINVGKNMIRLLPTTK